MYGEIYIIEWNVEHFWIISFIIENFRIKKLKIYKREKAEKIDIEKIQKKKKKNLKTTTTLPAPLELKYLCENPRVTASY